MITLEMFSKEAALCFMFLPFQDAQFVATVGMLMLIWAAKPLWRRVEYDIRVLITVSYFPSIGQREMNVATGASKAVGIGPL